MSRITLRNRLAIRGDSNEEINRRLEADSVDFESMLNARKPDIHVKRKTNIGPLVERVLKTLERSK